MPATISWYIENEIVYTHYTGGLTLTEFEEHISDAKDMLESSPRDLVHIIADVGDVEEALPLPDVLKAIRNFGQFPANAGWFVILREKSLIVRLGFTMGTSLFKARTRAFNTMEETIAFLKEKDEAITWDKADESVLHVK